MKKIKEKRDKERKKMPECFVRNTRKRLTFAECFLFVKCNKVIKTILIVTSIEACELQLRWI